MRDDPDWRPRIWPGWLTDTILPSGDRVTVWTCDGFDEMSNKLPQPTDVLAKRLRRVASFIDRLLETDWAGTSDAPQWKARANTCWQAAARLEEYQLEREQPLKAQT